MTSEKLSPNFLYGWTKLGAKLTSFNVSETRNEMDFVPGNISVVMLIFRTPPFLPQFLAYLTSPPPLSR